MTARAQRRKGASLSEISQALSVSYSTVRRWTLDIALTSEQQAAMDAKVEISRTSASHVMAERRRVQRRAWQDEGRSRAQQEDPLHLAGCMLYWAEGSKLRNALSIANSDPNLLRLFLAFLRQEFPQYLEALTFRINVYTGNGLEVDEIESHWLGLLDLGRECVRKHTVNNRPSRRSGTKANKLPYGVATIDVNRTHAVQHVWGAIQQYGSFTDPRLLDL